MNNERERRRLNRRLLSGTFWAELKNFKLKPCIVLRDVVTIFIACFATTWLAALFTSISWLTDMIFFLLAMALVVVMGKLIDKALHKVFKK